MNKFINFHQTIIDANDISYVRCAENDPMMQIGLKNAHTLILTFRSKDLRDEIYEDGCEKLTVYFEAKEP